MGLKLRQRQTTSKKVKIDKSMRDYSKEEFFVKKAKEAKKFLAKVGLPKELL